MLALSDNPSADYLLDLVGVEAVNQTLQRLGCRDSQIVVGFQDANLGPGGRVNVGTAADMHDLIKAVCSDSRYREVRRALSNSLRNIRIPLRLPDERHVPHKTGSLEGVANDIGVIDGPPPIGLAFLSDQQEDTAKTSMQIGDCVLALYTAILNSTA